MTAIEVTDYLCKVCHKPADVMMRKKGMYIEWDWNYCKQHYPNVGGEK